MTLEVDNNRGFLAFCEQGLQEEVMTDEGFKEVLPAPAAAQMSGERDCKTHGPV